jgi:hypothetical protein
MRVRERILHSERQPGGAVTVVRIVTTVQGKRFIRIVQTIESVMSTVTLDAMEYRSLVSFASPKRVPSRNPTFSV